MVRDPRVFDRCLRCDHRRHRRRFLGSLYSWQSRSKLCLCYGRQRTTTYPPPAQESFPDQQVVASLQGEGGHSPSLLYSSNTNISFFYSADEFEIVRQQGTQFALIFARISEEFLTSGFEFGKRFEVLVVQGFLLERLSRNSNNNKGSSNNHFIRRLIVTDLPEK